MKLVAGREVGVDQLEKFLTDVGLYSLTERGLNQMIFLRLFLLLGGAGLYFSTWSCPLRRRASW